MDKQTLINTIVKSDDNILIFVEFLNKDTHLLKNIYINEKIELEYHVLDLCNVLIKMLIIKDDKNTIDVMHGEKDIEEKLNEIINLIDDKHLRKIIFTLYW